MCVCLFLKAWGGCEGVRVCVCGSVIGGRVRGSVGRQVRGSVRWWGGGEVWRVGAVHECVNGMVGAVCVATTPSRPQCPNARLRFRQTARGHSQGGGSGTPGGQRGLNDSLSSSKKKRTRSTPTGRGTTTRSGQTTSGGRGGGGGTGIGRRPLGGGHLVAVEADVELQDLGGDPVHGHPAARGELSEVGDPQMVERPAGEAGGKMSGIKY